MKHNFIRKLFIFSLTTITLLGTVSICANAEWKQNSNGQWNYIVEDGSILKNKWLYDKSTDVWCHLNEEGIRTTGWFKNTDGKWYYLYDNGRLAINTTTPDGFKVGSDGSWTQNNTINNISTTNTVNNINNGIINNGGVNTNVINNYNNYGVINTNISNKNEENYNNQSNNVNPSVKVKTTLDLETLLNDNYSSLKTPIGTLKFDITVRDNDNKMFPYDLEINTNWGEIDNSKYDLDSFNPSDLTDSIKISDEDKKKTKELLKDYQKKISEITIKYFPNKKIKGGFYSGFYKYQSLRTGYESVQFYSWKNYDVDLSSYKYYTEQYEHSTLSNFNWDDKDDNYNLD